jgi:Fe-S cluster assembly protein SufD
MNPSGLNGLAQQWSGALEMAKMPPGPPWLQELRKSAAGQFGKSGLPHRKVEAWKYTPLRQLEKRGGEISGSGVPVLADCKYPEVLFEASNGVIDIVNGALTGRLPESPEYLSVCSFAEGLERWESRLRPMLENVELSGPARAFAALNTAVLDQGLVVRVPENTDAGSLLIRWTSSPAGNASFNNFRLFVLLGPGARLELIEQYQGGEADSALNVMCQVELEEHASLGHVRVQSETESSLLLTSSSIVQSEDSHYRYHGFDTGGGLVRHEINAILAGRGASADIAGAFVLDNSRLVDNHVSVDHAAPDCSSRQFFRGVLGGRSRGVFNGRALIQPGADGSSVYQSNANLLLSEQAVMNTKPELEIYADEVEASHGATVGQLDEAAVFYLRSRGLSDNQARRILTTAFCRAVTDRLGDQSLARRVAAALDFAMPGEVVTTAGEG